MSIRNLWFVGAALVAALLAPRHASAQSDKVVASFSLASFSELLGDAGYLAEVAGSPGVEQMGAQLVGPFIQGLDKSRPLGGVVYVTSGGEFEVLGFVPVTNLDQIMNTLNSPPVNAGLTQQDGVWTKAGPELYIKEQGGWAFITNVRSRLNSLPADPLAELGGIDKRYDLAVRASLDNLPAQYRSLATSAYQGVIMQQAAQPRDPSEAEWVYELRQKLTRLQAEQTKQLIEETKELLIGFAIDRDSKSVYLDTEMVAMQGTATATRFSNMKETTSHFAGFLNLPATVNFLYSVSLGPAEIEIFRTLLTDGRRQAMAQVDSEASLDSATRDRVKGILTDVMDVLQGTVDGGKLDAGFYVDMKPGSMNMAMGGVTADGPKLDKAFREFLALARDDPEFPQLNMDTSQHGGATIHQMTVPIPAGEDKAIKLLGPSVELVFATGPKTVFVAFGQGSKQRVTKLIDDSQTPQNVLPMLASISVGSILNFATAVDENPDPALIAAAAALKSNSKDHVVVQTTPVPAGFKTRMEVEEGIFKLLGVIGKAAAGAAGGGF